MPGLIQSFQAVRSPPPQKRSGSCKDSVISLDWHLHSPPDLVRGSVVFGEMLLQVIDKSIEIISFKGALNLHIKHSEPFKRRCSDCKHQDTKLETWEFLPEGTLLLRGTYKLPFSALIQGNLPATSDTPNTCSSYNLQAEIKVRSTSRPSTPLVTTISERPLTVSALASVTDAPRYSTHAFRPIGVTAAADIDPVLQPSEANKASISLSGLRQTASAGGEALWRVRRAAWRLEETIKSTALACERHKRGDAEELNGIARTKTRLLSCKDYHDTWKTSEDGGTAHVEFDFGLNHKTALSRPAKYHDDLTAVGGMEVSHSLVVELVMVKEHRVGDRDKKMLASGVVQVLRIPYKVVLSSTGIDWENEGLPRYQDACLGPPDYVDIDLC